MRLVLRQGEGLTRTRNEISNALQAKLDAEKKDREKDRKE